MAFTDYNGCADGARTNENRHSYCAGDILRIASEHTNCCWASKNELNADEKKNNTSENLKRSKFSLQYVGENCVAEQGECTKHHRCNQSSADEDHGELFSVKFFDYINKVNNYQERVEEYQ